MTQLTELELLDHIDPSQLDYQDLNQRYKVYIHINKTNDKKYVGITKRPVKKRWRNGRGYKDCTHFGRAIKKYGWDGFEHIVYAENLTQEDACKLEITLIARYQSVNPKFGYNSTFGGESNVRRPEISKRIGQANKGKCLSKETRQKISEARKGMVTTIETRQKLSSIMKGKRIGENHPLYGKPVSDETRQKISVANKGENHPNYGKHLSIETRKKISSTQSGSNSPKARKVICLTTGEQFGAISEATLKYKINKTGIIRCCQGKGRQKTAGKHPITGEPLCWGYCDGKENSNDG